MPDAAVVKVIVEHYGWPIVTVAVLLICLYGMTRLLFRVMGKHEGQWEGQRSEMARMAVINQNIVDGLKAVATEMGRHDQDEDQRHRDTRDRFDRRSPR